MVPVESQMNPVHTFPSYFPKIHSNIIFTHTPRFSERKLTTHLHLPPTLVMRDSIPPLPQYIFMAWCLVKQRNNFTFTLSFSCRLSEAYFKNFLVIGKEQPKILNDLLH
jgi:hypothetical protein